MKRLFEVATPKEWNRAKPNPHLDVAQAIAHLKKNLEPYVRIALENPTHKRLDSKRHIIYAYARRAELNVQIRFLDGWIYIRNVTKQFRESGAVRRLKDELPV